MMFVVSVKDVLIDFVGDQEEVMLEAEAADELELLSGEYLSRRVVGRVEDDCTNA
jgi:hypothetical protein